MMRIIISYIFFIFFDIQLFIRQTSSFVLPIIYQTKQGVQQQQQLQQQNDIIYCSRSRSSSRSTRITTTSSNRKTRLYLRNFDLPEALIFYGIDTILNTNNYESCTTSSTSTITNANELLESLTNNNNNDDDGSTKQKLELRPGVLRLMKESQEINTPMIILSEHLTMEQIQNLLDDGCNNNALMDLIKDDILHIRSSLEEYKVDYTKLQYENGSDGNDNDNDDNDQLEYEYPSTFIGEGFGHAPSPAALIDAIHSIFINPRGFGGSSGFGVKYADAVRNPLPQHCVVFVSKSSDDNPLRSGSGSHSDTSGSVSRDRCVASKLAGMRVMYLEDGCLGSCTAEDVSDGIIDTLGTENDWEMVTMDDISTPGSFWLNMAQPRDENGDRVNSFDAAASYRKARMESKKSAEPNDSGNTTPQSDISIENSNDNDELDEDEIQRILADLNPL